MPRTECCYFSYGNQHHVKFTTFQKLKSFSLVVGDIVCGLQIQFPPHLSNLWQCLEPNPQHATPFKAEGSRKNGYFTVSLTVRGGLESAPSALKVKKCKNFDPVKWGLKQCF